MTTLSPIDEKTAVAAAEWFFRLQESSATEKDRQACVVWRQANPLHEAAWQRAQEVSAKLGILPGGLASATLQLSRTEGRRRAVKSLAVLVVAGSVGWQAWRSESARLYFAQYSTRVGERREIALADGTQVHLNTASGINTNIDQTQRLILLEAGEILIQTGHDNVPPEHPAYRPLLVETRYGTLRPLGTRFIVRQQHDDISLAVLQGAVEITTSSGMRQVLAVGWQTTFSSRKIRQPAAVNQHADSWIKGVLHAREMRLKDFAAELERYRPGFLRCAPEVAELRISGAFQLNNTDQVIASLPQVLPVRISYRTRYWVALTSLSN